jgi:hypothetical protein
VTDRHTPEKLLQQEVRELTDLLREEDSLAGLRAALAARGALASETILLGLFASEDESQYGVVLTASRECVRFETAPGGSLTRWEIIDDPETLACDFPAVSVGVSMAESGQVT